ncbi:MAG: CRISPR-associated endonuclease Cas3'', partial [Acidobacteriota bacterium]
MKGRPTGFWGKLKRDDDGNVVAWHPLVDHCVDVAAVCEALLERTVLRSRLARLAGLDDLCDTLIARLSVLALLHDIGKFNHGFRAKALPKHDTAGHLEEVLAVLNYENGCKKLTHQLLASLRAEQLGDWGSQPGGDDVFQLLIATISHHGRPVRIDRAEKIHQAYWEPVRDLDPLAGIADLVTKSQTWFPLAWQQGGAKLPAAPEFQHAWSGLLMLADWLGSDDAEDRFPYRSERDDSDRMPFARNRAHQVLERIGLDAEPARRSLIAFCGDAAPSFQTLVPDSEPWAAQRAMLALPTDEPGSVTVLESETGSGKTEAALVRYLRLFHAGQVDGMVFALPTRTAATQIHSRVIAAIENAFPEAVTRPAVVLGVPGYLRVDRNEGTRLARFEVKWDDEPTRYRAWAAEVPKRYLAGPI